MGFSYCQLEIPEIIVITTEKYTDQRGYFLEVYKRSWFKENGIFPEFVQINHSHSTQNVLRGLHYQINPMAQGKLVSVLKGKIYDVAVDIRKGSPTYGQWVGKYLSAGKPQMLWIPAGFAHGFFVASEEADVVYMVSEEYAPTEECGIVWNDPDIAIQWPIDDPILSEKDIILPRMAEAENNFVYKDMLR